MISCVVSRVVKGKSCSKMVSSEVQLGMTCSKDAGISNSKACICGISCSKVDILWYYVW